MSELDKLREAGQRFGVDVDGVVNEVAGQIEVRLGTKLSQAVEDLKASVAQSLAEMKSNSGGGSGDSEPSVTPGQIRGMIEQQVAGMKDEIIDGFRASLPQDSGGSSGNGKSDLMANLPAIADAIGKINQPQGGSLDRAIATLEQNIAPLARLQNAMAAMQPPQPSVDSQFRANQNAWMLGFKEGARAQTSKKGGEPPKVPSGLETMPDE